MNLDVVRSAVGALEKLLSQARRALWEVEREVFGDPGYGDADGTYAYPRDAMKSHLKELYDALLVVLEGAEMPEARASLIKEWRGFTQARGVTGDSTKSKCIASGTPVRITISS